MAGDQEQLSLVVERDERRVLVRLRGELDIATAPRLVDVLDGADREVVIDLEELAFLDAHGLDALAHGSAHAELQGDRLVVVNANPLARRMFEITGLDHLLVTRGAV
jgi:anti-sigma B factor antagonist